MTKIYLVRHAEAEGNLYRIAHGHYNGLITDWRGPKQIRALAQRFEGIRVDAVYSSDLYRTQTTAQAVYVPEAPPAAHLSCLPRGTHGRVGGARMARGEPPVAGGVLSLQPPHRPLAARGRRKCPAGA